MLNKLQFLVARYTELSQRERVMLAVAIVAMSYFAFDSLLITPQLDREKTLAKKEMNQKVERSTIQAALNQQKILADESLTLALQERDALQLTVSRGEQIVNAARRSTDVAPLLRRMVQSLPGLQLATLRTSPTSVYFQPKAATAPAGQAGAADKGAQPPATSTPAPAPAVVLPTLYSKAVEATVQGNYLDLLTYLRKLREYPGALYWDTATVNVTAYPKANLSLMLNMLTTESDTPPTAVPR